MKILSTCTQLLVVTIVALHCSDSRSQTIPAGMGTHQADSRRLITAQPTATTSQSAAKIAKGAGKMALLVNVMPLAPTADGIPACVDLEDPPLLQEYGVPKTVALRTLCSVGKDAYLADDFNDAFTLISKIDDGDGYADAIKDITDRKPDLTKPLIALINSAVNATPQVPSTDCVATYDPTTKQLDYQVLTFLPAARTKCGSDSVQQFFLVRKSATFGNTVQYLYNPNQGTNQYSSDLVTATFPQGFQVILAGTATTGTTQSTPQTGQTGSTTPSTPAPDPVATAVQKIEAGGDFNLRFSLPLLSTPPGNTAWMTYFQPALGFNLASTTGTTNQSTGAQTGISSTSQYLFYLPLESYFETSSLTGTTANGWSSANLYLDLRYGGEIVSRDFQKMIGVPNRVFALAQASAGVDFAGSFRVGMQYFYGPSQVYTLTSSSGQTGTVSTSVKGFHVVLSYSPAKGSK